MTSNSIVRKFLTDLKATIEQIKNPELENIEVIENVVGLAILVESKYWLISILVSMDANSKTHSATFGVLANSSQRSYALTLLAMIDAVETFNREQTLWSQVKATYEEYNESTAIMRCMILFQYSHEQATRAVGDRAANEGWQLAEV
jgi:hypothetical protein